MRTLEGRTALVCGSSHGIGRACAIELSRAGAAVTLVARDESALKEALAALDTGSSQMHRYIAADFTDPQSVRARVEAHLSEHGPIQILVNNTGGPPHGAITDAKPEDFQRAIAMHVICNQLLVQTLLPGMRISGYGRVVNIISTSVIQPIRGLGVSNTTRGAVANWGRTLAAELAPFGITVNNVLPGFTRTDRLQTLFKAKAEKAGKTIKEVEQAVVDSIPLGRMADPKEIGAVVAFLASPAASYVSGVNLPVDGARTAIQ
jgi:3-oxoacyl-[acyl-carrier protein] reductase